MSTNIIEQLDAAAAPLLAARAEIEKLHAEVIALRADADALQTALVQESHRIGDIEQERAAAWQDAADARELLAQAEQQLADLVHGTGDGVPALPRQRKYMGTAYNTDGECMTRTDTELEAHGKHCYARGLAQGRSQAKTQPGAAGDGDYSDARRLDDDIWAARQRGDWREVERLQRGGK